MARLKINLWSQDEAFTADGRGETVRCLSEVVKKIANGQDTGSIYDVNGNKVGSFTFEDWGNDTSQGDDVKPVKYVEQGSNSVDWMLEGR